MNCPTCYAYLPSLHPVGSKCNDSFHASKDDNSQCSCEDADVIHCLVHYPGDPNEETD